MTDALPVRLGRHYDTACDWGGRRDQRNRERVEATLALVPASVETVLDVGCGDGAVSGDLASRGLDVVGVDLSTAALKHFGGAPVVAEIAALPFLGSAFDLVMALEILEHLPDDAFDLAREELVRLSRRYVLVSTPNEEYLPAGYTSCPYCGARFHRNLHVRSLGRREHSQLLEAHGYRHRATVAVSEWRPSATWTRLRRYAGGPHAEPPMRACPRCGAKGVSKDPPDTFRRFALRAVDAIGWRMTRPVPRWLISLHERR